MKRIILTIALSLATAVVSALGQTSPPGSLLTAAGQVNGSLTVTSSWAGGCSTRICTTNYVTYSRCYTNWYWKFVCITNSAGQIQCTNMPVPVTFCYTNTFPELSCTNVVANPTSLNVREVLTGELAAVTGCDEFFGKFPSNAMFTAVLRLDVRTNDWVGTQIGSFKIVAGTNVLAAGSLSGVTGVGTVPGGPCAICNHFQGTLVGSVLWAGPVPGARIQAAYSGDLTGVMCPSSSIPQGAVSLLINGVATTSCYSGFGFPMPFAPVLSTQY